MSKSPEDSVVSNEDAAPTGGSGNCNCRSTTGIHQSGCNECSDNTGEFLFYCCLLKFMLRRFIVFVILENALVIIIRKIRKVLKTTCLLKSFSKSKFFLQKSSTSFISFPMWTYLNFVFFFIYFILVICVQQNRLKLKIIEIHIFMFNHIVNQTVKRTKKICCIR